MSAALIEKCQGKWRQVLTGVGIPADALTGRQTACPKCGGSDRFIFDDKNGSGSWLCRAEGKAGYGIHMVQWMLGRDYRSACEAIERVLVAEPQVMAHPRREPGIRAEPDPSRALSAGLAIWKASVRIGEGNSTNRYLASRGLQDVVDVCWLRHGEQITYLDDDGVFCGMFPAMLAVVKDVNGKVVALHRTFLTRQGAKADVPSPRKVLGTLPEGSAIQLAPHGPVLGIAEGIETALAASIVFGVPCWSALTAGGLEKWKPPTGVERVVIFGDNDTNCRGQAAAYVLANRLATLGRSVRVEIPGAAGQDWNDVLRTIRRAA